MLDRLAAGIERERRFIADASHELRTPLAAIETALDVTLSRPRSDETYRETLHATLAQSRRLSRMVRQLLLLSRMDSGTAPTGFTAVDCGPVATAAIAGFSAAHPSPNVRTTIPESGTTVQGNAELLSVALTNLLENAVVHGGEDAEIDVTLARRDEALLITVSDDGPGVPAELRERAFRRFQRGADSGSRPGSGLGLAIVEAIVHLHGGSVRFEEVARGATVRIELPRSIL